MYESKEKKKRKVTILVNEDIYMRLEDKGVFKKRRFSELINSLLFDYLQNETINSIENRNKDFITESIERAMDRSFSDIEDKLLHIYSSSVYSSLVLNSISDLTQSEFEEIKNKTRREKTKFMSPVAYNETFLEKSERPAGNMVSPGEKTKKPREQYDDDDENITIDFEDLDEDE